MTADTRNDLLIPRSALQDAEAELARAYKRIEELEAREMNLEADIRDMMENTPRPLAYSKDLTPDWGQLAKAARKK